MIQVMSGHGIAPVLEDLSATFTPIIRPAAILKEGPYWMRTMELAERIAEAKMDLVGCIRSLAIQLTLLLSVLSLASLPCASQSSHAESRQVSVTPKDYYVDSQNGSDANPGNSPDLPWRTLAQITRVGPQPGDVIHLKRGSRWTSSLDIYRSGTSEYPIRYTDYGEGDLPTISRAMDHTTYPRGILVDADWIILENLRVTEIAAEGIALLEKAEHNIVRHCEISQVGIGIAVYGDHNEIADNDIHDLRMVRNTRGGDDDYGAIGILLSASDNQVVGNRMTNCRAPSYDYGVDGGAIELYGNVSQVRIDHNWAEHCAGFLEAGGDDQAGRTISAIRVTYNVLVDNSRVLHFNLGNSRYAATIQGFVLDHNTILESTPWETAINFVGGELSGNQLILRNNILVGFSQLARKLDLTGGEAPSTGFLHAHNLYQGLGPHVPLGDGEWQGDPRFVDPVSHDFRLLPDSPALDAGLDLGYPLDFDQQPVPIGPGPDLGAYEVPAAPPPTPTPDNGSSREVTISLEAGWNPVAVPLLNTEEDLSALLTTHCDVILRYDPSNTTDPWKRHVFQSPAYANDLGALQPGMGIWVHAREAAEIRVTGQPLERHAIPLSPGWNLVAYPADAPNAPASGLAGIAELCEGIYACRPAPTGSGYMTPPQPIALGPGAWLVPGQVYWVRVHDSCTWSL
jgi:hypothetical protein